MRPSGRSPDGMREIAIETDISRYAEGSCLISFGHTRVMCTASVEDGVPPFLKGTGKGWVTAEYGMLPRSTGRAHAPRRPSAGKQGGRTLEISAPDRAQPESRDVNIEGHSASARSPSTATSSRPTAAPAPPAITGAMSRCMIAPSSTLPDDGPRSWSRAFRHDRQRGCRLLRALRKGIAPFSIWIMRGFLDADRRRQLRADRVKGGIVEIQGTAEADKPFSEAQFDELLELCRTGASPNWPKPMQKLTVGTDITDCGAEPMARHFTEDSAGHRQPQPGKVREIADLLDAPSGVEVVSAGGFEPAGAGGNGDHLHRATPKSRPAPPPKPPACPPWPTIPAWW